MQIREEMMRSKVEIGRNAGTIVILCEALHLHCPLKGCIVWGAQSQSDHGVRGEIAKAAMVRVSELIKGDTSLGVAHRVGRPLHIRGYRSVYLASLRLRRA